MDSFSSIKDYFPGIKDKYTIYRSLISSQNYTLDDPYASKYAARDILYEMELMSQNSKEADTPEYKDKRAIICYLVGQASCEVEDYSHAEKYTRKAFNFIAHEPVEPNRIVCAISCLNHLGQAEIKKGNFQPSQVLLENAENIYKLFNEKYDKEPPDFDLIFTGISNKGKMYDQIHTKTLTLLSKVYNVLKNEKYAEYCHLALQKQWNRIQWDVSLDVVEWSLNCMILSRFLLEENAFEEARHHLAAATEIIEDFQRFLLYLSATQEKDFEGPKLKNIPKKVDSEKLERDNYVANERLAELQWHWGKYGIRLLVESKNKIVGKNVHLPPGRLKGLYFIKFLKRLKDIETSIPCDYISGYKDAESIFVKSLEYLNKAKEYYVLKYYTKEHIEVVLETSKLYMIFTFFEESNSNKIELHEARISILEEVLNGINKTSYMFAVRQIWYEIGEICLEIQHILSSKEVEIDTFLKEKNQNISKRAIINFEKLIDSFQEPRSDAETEIPLKYQKCILNSYKHLGGLYSETNDYTQKKSLEMLTKSLQYYENCVDYCSTHEELKMYISEETEHCQKIMSEIRTKMRELETPK